MKPGRRRLGETFSAAGPTKQPSVSCSSASPRRVRRAALPSRPSMGLSSGCTCMAMARASGLSLCRPSAVTISAASPLPNSPLWNMSSEATARPSERAILRPVLASSYFHWVPAPASSRTETTKRSTRRRAASMGSKGGDADAHRWSSWETRGIPWTSKWRHRPWAGMAEYAVPKSRYGCGETWYESECSRACSIVSSLTLIMPKQYSTTPGNLSA